MPDRKRYTVAVDFDGVLHRYDTPWIAPHVIPDAPVEGAIEWLHDMVQHFDVVIFTTRARTWRGRRAVRRWLRYWGRARSRWVSGAEVGGIAGTRHGLRSVTVTAVKPAALVYLDDRAVRFEGPATFPTAEEVHRLRPWHYPHLTGCAGVVKMEPAKEKGDNGRL